MASTPKAVEKYSKVKLLGKGSYGSAILVEQASDKTFAVIKKIDFTEEHPEVMKEALLLKQMSHPNIIKLKEFYLTKKKKLWIVMEYADGGDISTKIKKIKDEGSVFTEAHIIYYFSQICDGIKYCHDKKIFHRDIKSQNIFVTSNDDIKIGDFGISKVLDNTKDNLQTLVGTPCYLSPEIIENQWYNIKSDIYALGVLLYEMWALRHPFRGDSIHALALQIVSNKYDSLSDSYSLELRQLVDNLLSKDPEQRMSIDKIIEYIVSYKTWLPESD